MTGFSKYSVLNNCKSVCRKWPACAGLDVSSTRTRTLRDNINKQTLGVMSLERKLCWTNSCHTTLQIHKYSSHPCSFSIDHVSPFWVRGT